MPVDRSLFAGNALTRRDVLRLGSRAAGAAALAPLLAACPAPPDEELVPDDDVAEPPPAEPDPDADLLFLSTQLQPVEEAEAVRNVILADFPHATEFIGEEYAPWADRMIAEAEAGEGTVDVAGGLHGDFAELVERGALMDLSDLADELVERGFREDYLEFARFGRDETYYIPWMEATYIMAARQEALDHLPDGADLDTLTYEQWEAWGAAIHEETGAQRLGFPAADDGLIHRFFQGATYPSFTGALNTRFASDDAVPKWEWMQAAWEHAHPQSVTYAFMQEPLLGAEVWVTWDHVARLIEAFRTDPDTFVAFASPRGPQGLGFMPVLAGLAIPVTAPNPERSRELIEYMTRPETAAVTLEQVGFFPPFEAELPPGLPAGIQAQADAVVAQSGDPDAVPSLLPIGLGEEAGRYNDVFRTTFERIALGGEDIRTVLDDEAGNLQAVLDAADASCWAPDPEGEGVCQVG